MSKSGYLSFCPRKLKELRLAQRISSRDLFTRADVTLKTGYSFLNGNDVQMRTAKKLFGVLGVDDFRPYLSSGDEHDGVEATTDLAEWEIAEVRSPWITTSNRLQYRIYKLRHRLLSECFGRGKCYDLAHLSTREDERVRTQLLRHPEVCRRIGPHPRIAINERVHFSNDETRLWVIDRWEADTSLDDALTAGPLDQAIVPDVLKQIAEGIQVLHQHQIILRELSPYRIQLRESDSSVIITDFELAKLIDGSPTVSTTWPVDHYRAPEIGDGEITPTVDFYSWGKIALYVITGTEPSEVVTKEDVAGLPVPESVQNVIGACVSPSFRQRPNSIDVIHDALEGW